MLASGMWAKLTDPELSKKSQLIVRGELGPVRQLHPKEGVPLWAGEIRVEAVLKGPSDLKVALLVLPSPEGPRSTTDLGYREGHRGLWFLRDRPPEGSGLYLADHPQRFVPHSKAGRIQQLEKTIATGP